MSYTFIFLSSFFYLLASVFFVIYLKRLTKLALQFGEVLVSLGLLSHLWILFWHIMKGDASFQNASMISNLSVTALAAGMALFLAVRRRALIISIIILPVTGISMFVITFLAERYAAEALPSLWLWTHIGLMILGELMFFMAATTAAAYLIVYRLLRKKHGLQVLTTVSSLPALDRVLGILLNLGLLLLSLGLMLGVIFAQQFWEGNWWKDPKVIFAGLIWIAYTILVLWRRARASFRGYTSALGALVGFVLILALSVGIDFFLPSQHQGSLPSTEFSQ